jgi:hypothetical protein
VLWWCVQAEADAERLNARFEALAEAALADGDPREAQGTSSKPAAAAAAAAGSESAADDGAAAIKVELLRRAEAAEQVGMTISSSSRCTKTVVQPKCITQQA